MKSMKKFSALLLAGLLSMTAAAPAFAAESVPTRQTIAEDSAANEQGKYTISVAEGDTHTYTVYQILKGTLIAGEQKLGNPAWGADVVGTGDVNAFINSLTTEGLSNTQIDDLVKAQLKTENPTNQGTVAAGSSMDVEPGYYFLVDTTKGLAEGDAKSLSIVAVFNDITITPKKGTTTSEKHVDDQNDSKADDHSELKDSADYDIGDTIPYTLKATLPADYVNYKQYYLSFIDDMSAGLSYNGDAKIFFGESDSEGTAITFTESDESGYTGGKVYTYTIDDLKADTYASYSLAAGSVITIKYSATLDSDAVIGETGNPNTYHVKYSSNPNQDAGGTPETNETPDDVNIVFTYKTVFNKIDGNGKPLTGADFTLYKKVVDDSEAGFSWVNVTALNTGDGAKNPTKTTENFTNAKGEAANAKFTFAGLDAGDYKLEETTTPTGYNTIAPIEFTITATHELESDDPQLTALTGTDGKEFNMTPSIPDGSLTSDITNNQGSALPSTGGMGTTIIYIIGAILLVGAGVLLVTKKRMAK